MNNTLDILFVFWYNKDAKFNKQKALLWSYICEWGKKEGFLMKGFLEKIGVYGWGDVEPLIASALITKLPALLIGETGMGKTYAVTQIAKNLVDESEFSAYDASKSLFEDIIGFPRFKENKGEAKVYYATSPITIWEKKFIFIDEISRALPDTQSKWLEVIRERKIMGAKLSELEYIFSAMNPVNDYYGTFELDRALIDRFGVYIMVPKFLNLNEDEKLKIIKNKNSRLRNLKRIVEEKRKLYKNALSNKALISSISKYLLKLSNSLSKHDETKFMANGRRFDMAVKTMTAIIVFETSKIDKISEDEENIRKMMKKYYVNLFPFYPISASEELIKKIKNESFYREKTKFEELKSLYEEKEMALFFKEIEKLVESIIYPVEIEEKKVSEVSKAMKEEINALYKLAIDKDIRADKYAVIRVQRAWNKIAKIFLRNKYPIYFIY